MKQVNEFLKANPLVALLATLGLAGGGMYYMQPAKATPKEEAKTAPAPVVAPPAPGVVVGQTPVSAQTVSFVVASTGQSPKTGLKYLNSHVNYRDPGNQSIAFPASSPVLHQQFLGKTVAASGIAVRTASGGTMITVTDPSQIQAR